MLIDYNDLKKANACCEGMVWFLETFGKEKVEISKVIDSCHNPSWKKWLSERYKDDIDYIVAKLEGHRFVSEGEGITVIGHIYNKVYILCWYVDNGKFYYGFKPLNSIAYYEFGVGTTQFGMSLKEYLTHLKKDGMQIKYYKNLHDAIMENT